VRRLLEKDDIKEFYLGVKDAGVRGTRPLEEEEDVAVSAATVHGQDTLPKLFRHVVAERGDGVAMREKDLGILARDPPGGSTASGAPPPAWGWWPSPPPARRGVGSWPTTVRSGSTPISARCAWAV